MTTNGSRRTRRPHPARRARTLAGSLSVVGMLGLTGCMAAANKPQAATQTATTAIATTATATGVTSSSTYDTTSRSSTAAAVASTSQSAQTATSTHAS